MNSEAAPWQRLPTAFGGVQSGCQKPCGDARKKDVFEARILAFLLRESCSCIAQNYKSACEEQAPIATNRQLLTAGLNMARQDPNPLRQCQQLRIHGQHQQCRGETASKLDPMIFSHDLQHFNQDHNRHSLVHLAQQNRCERMRNWCFISFKKFNLMLIIL